MMGMPPGTNGAPSTTPPNGTGEIDGHEPNPLPGAPVETLPPPPGVGPTAQRSQGNEGQLRGPGPQNSASGDDGDHEAIYNDIDDETSDDAGSRPTNSNDNGKLSSYRRTPRANAAAGGPPTARVQPVAGRALDAYRRPTASRLFSPTR
jgi:hypothetical protein